ncbi:MAG: CDP-glucose 4,6-dehydratase [Bacteroidetes bacterium]|nr:CDP-glucose 4,6-dehydratase [Bacteroidota bacterium]
MEEMVMSQLFGGIYKGKRVVVTGHTGFKGSWLTYWLHRMGADVYGIALEPATEPDHLSLLDFPYTSVIQDINDGEHLKEILLGIDPDIIFHLAAQALVRASYERPVGTFRTNIMGTVNVLECSRELQNLKAVVIVTSDKCYDNREWAWGYRENDPLGGKDPYSASKGCAELVTASYRQSFFNPSGFGHDHHVLVASARAGNVIGGGDWAPDRIVPDLIRAASSQHILQLRYPLATRPWQHVLEPLSGYLLLGWELLEGKTEIAEAWNFGPELSSNVSVLDLVKESILSWPSVKYEVNTNKQPHEASFLYLDSSKAKMKLLWDNVWSFPVTVKHTLSWYRDYYGNIGVNTLRDLDNYIIDASKKSLIWTLK